MRSKKVNLRELSNKLYGLNVSEELFELRDKFCPAKGQFLCDKNCPIFSKYVAIGSMSCNKALNEFPQECEEIIKITMKKEG